MLKPLNSGFFKSKIEVHATKDIFIYFTIHWHSKGQLGAKRNHGEISWRAKLCFEGRNVDEITVATRWEVIVAHIKCAAHIDTHCNVLFEHVRRTGPTHKKICHCSIKLNNSISYALCKSNHLAMAIEKCLV